MAQNDIKCQNKSVKIIILQAGIFMGKKYQFFESQFASGVEEFLTWRSGAWNWLYQEKKKSFSYKGIKHFPRGVSKIILFSRANTDFQVVSRQHLNTLIAGTPLPWQTLALPNRCMYESTSSYLLRLRAHSQICILPVVFSTLFAFLCFFPSTPILTFYYVELVSVVLVQFDSVHLILNYSAKIYM